MRDPLPFAVTSDALPATAVDADGAAVVSRAPDPATLPSRVARWLPAAGAFCAIVGMLVNTHTPVLDIARYLAYVAWGLVLPATLGLVLEIGAWAAFSTVGGQRLLWLWPVLVVVPFLAVPGLRRHWRVSGYRPTPVGWSYAVAGMVVFLVGYVYVSYLRRTQPI